MAPAAFIVVDERWGKRNIECLGGRGLCEVVANNSQWRFHDCDSLN